MTEAPVVVIGAGPAGLTAAYELLEAGQTAIEVFDADTQVGGLSKTVVHHGNRIDIGGHRFFSKSDWVMRWWLDKLPIACDSDPATLKADGGHAFLAYQGKRRTLAIDNAARMSGDATMLIRDRLSRILFGGKLFAYPLKIDAATAWRLGPIACALYAASYIKARAFPRPEATLEDFFINRFGRRLYLRFFKTYTEKVWGRSCSEISAAWGAQRVKGLSISRAIAHAWRQLFRSRAAAKETSLIEHFLYPRLGPGQMWETVAARVANRGVPIRMATRVVGLKLVGATSNRRVTEVEIEDVASGRREWRAASQVISTMPIRELIAAIDGDVPARVREIADALEYRDFMTVGLLYRKLARSDKHAIPGRASVPDNWIYVQEPDVKVGRIQIFNNWSPYLVEPRAEHDIDTLDRVWVGLEFFCAEGDALWSSSDEDMIALAKREMSQIGMADADECIDAVVLRMPKAYPGYYGAYEHFDEVRAFLDSIENLYCIGRNGMHRYNNQDHSMLSAKRAVEAILAGSADKSAIWAVNIDDSYHEEADRPADAQGSRVIDDDEDPVVSGAAPATTDEHAFSPEAA